MQSTNASTVKLSSKNQIVLPKEARKMLGVRAGQDIQVIVDSYGIRLVPKVDVSQYMGVAKDLYATEGGGDEYLRKERAKWQEREEKIQTARSGTQNSA